MVPGGLGWRDAGELGAAAQVLGVAHPTGFALDMLWLKAWSLLPLGSLAFRQNLATATFGALLAGVVGRLIWRLFEGQGHRQHFGLGAAASGLVLLFAWPTLGLSVLVVEVYATGLLLVGLALLEVAGARRLTVLGVLLGFSLGSHVLAFAMVATIAAGAVLRAREEGTLSWKPLLVALGMVAVAAPVLLYLPLASLRQPVLDWGDPETPGRFWEHLSAARIRMAFREEMGGGSPAMLLGQFELLLPLLPGALLALGAARGRIQRFAWALLLLGLLDVAYALFVNPMGMVDRQVGHLAGLSFLILSALGLGAVAPRGAGVRKVAAFGLAVVGAFGALAMQRLDPIAHPFANEELYGAGGGLGALPPRSLVLCESDDACAALFFERYAQGLRPDVTGVVAPHLWEPRERARAQALLAFDGERPATAEQREAFVQRTLVRLREVDVALRSDQSRLRSGDLGNGVAAELGFFAFAASGTSDELLEQAALDQAALDHAAQVRGVVAGPGNTALAWARHRDERGKAALRGGNTAGALEHFAESLQLAPERPAGWSNLGVAQLRSGRPDAADAAYVEALRLEPARATAWVNRVELRVAAQDLEGARQLLQQAEEAGADDPRLDVWRQRLGFR